MSIFTTISEVVNGLFILKSADGTYIKTYDSNPLEGYIVMIQRRPKLVQLFSGSKLVASTRQCLFNGEVALLEAIVAEWTRTGIIPGHIVSKDKLHSELPESVRNSKSLERNAKTAGKDGVQLTLGGEQIYQSRYYTTDMTDPDVKIQHDNTEAVTAQNLALRQARTLTAPQADAVL